MFAEFDNKLFRIKICPCIQSQISLIELNEYFFYKLVVVQNRETCYLRKMNFHSNYFQLFLT